MNRCAPSTAVRRRSRPSWASSASASSSARPKPSSAATVAADGVLREGGDLLRERERGRERVVGHDRVSRPIASASAASIVRPVRIRSSARPAPRRAGAAASRRRPAARPSGARRSRRSRPGSPPAGRTRARLEPAGQAMAGDRGDRRLGGGQAGEAQRAARGVGVQRLDRLEVGAGAERLLARAGQHQHVGVVFAAEALEGRRSSAAAVSPSTALWRSGRSIVTSAAGPRRS